MKKRIYSDFDELLQENKSLFHYFRKSNKQSFLKAIWEARSPEILYKTSLINKLDRLTSSQDKTLDNFHSLIKTLEKKLDFEVKTNERLRDQIRANEISILQMENKQSILEANLSEREEKAKELEQYSKQYKKLNNKMSVELKKYL